jgi:hypothetical protein
MIVEVNQKYVIWHIYNGLDTKWMQIFHGFFVEEKYIKAISK